MASLFSGINPQYRKVIILSSIIVVLLLAQPFLWKQVMNQAISLRSQRSRVEQTTNVNQHIAAMKQSQVDQEQFATQLAITVPPQDNLIQAVEQLEQLADSHGASVDITNISQQVSSEDSANQDESNLVQFTVSFTLIGNANLILNYLSDVEHIAETSYVRSLTISPATATENPLVITATNFQLTGDIVFFLSKQDTI